MRPITTYAPAMISFMLGGLIIISGTSMAQDNVTKEDVIKMHIKQLGGEEKLKAIKTMTTKAIMVLPGPTGDMEAEVDSIQDGNKFRMTMNLPGLGEIQQGSDGKTYWTTNPFQGDKLMNKEEAALAKEQYGVLFPSLLWLKGYDGKIEMKGEAEVDGAKCYKLLFTPSVGDPMTRYFTADKGRLVKIDAVQKGMAGEVAVEVFPSEFDTIDGITLPFKQVTSMEQADITMEVDSIKFNEELPATRFKLPASIQKLVDEKK